MFLVYFCTNLNLLNFFVTFFFLLQLQRQDPVNMNVFLIASPPPKTKTTGKEGLLLVAAAASKQTCLELQGL